MPNRIVRESILTSRAVNRLSAEGEVFYRRLMSIVDDYGRHEADIDILRAKLFPLQLERYSADKCAQLLAEVSRVVTTDGEPLVSVYEASGRKFLQVNNFGQRTRASSKCPPPPASTRGQLRADDSKRAQPRALADSCAPMPANDGLDGGVCEDVCVGEGVCVIEGNGGGEATRPPTPCNPPPPKKPSEFDLEAGWEEFRREYPVERDVDAACRWYVSEMHRVRERDGPGADRKLHGEIMAGLRRHLASAAWRNRQTGELQLEFVPSMSRFLGMPNGKPTAGRMYLDRPPPWKRPLKGRSKTEFLERLARGEDVDPREDPNSLVKRLAKEVS